MLLLASNDEKCAETRKNNTIHDNQNDSFLLMLIELDLLTRICG